MLRALLRFVGLLCLAAGFATLVVDGTRSIAGGNLAFTQLGDTVAAVAPKTQEMTSDKAAVSIWRMLLQRLFEIPTWVVFGLVGLVFLFLGRPRTPLIGFTSRP